MKIKHNQIHIYNPLNIIPKKNNKHQLILNLHFLNKHLTKHKFKFKNLQIITKILQPNN